MAFEFPPLPESFNLARVLTFVATPFAPEEVSELGRVDLTVHDGGCSMAEVKSKSFDAIGAGEGEAAIACTPMHAAMSVWSRGTPDVLVAHDATSAAVLFGPALTRRLPWVSLHRVARRVWPSAPQYSLEGLARWHAGMGLLPGVSFALPSGAAREAHLSAKLLAALLADPVLRVAGRPVLRSDRARHRRAGAVLSDMVRCDALQAAVRISSLPAPPLRHPPGAWDDQREWASLGSEDVAWFARRDAGGWTGKAAGEELARRARVSAGQVDRWQGLILRRRRD